MKLPRVLWEGKARVAPDTVVDNLRVVQVDTGNGFQMVCEHLGTDAMYQKQWDYVREDWRAAILEAALNAAQEESCDV